MKLLRKVTVKQILTEAKKKTLLKQFDLEVIQIEREIEQMKFQLHKALKDVTEKSEKVMVRTRFQQEIENREEQLKSLAFKIQQLHKLEIGTEMNEGTVESISEVQVGDRWSESGRTEIIIKDGFIHEFRESRNEDDRMV
ncbi:YlqD family protein [Bacillus solitudinis]|uniref:YlqD family protein n=1 Tax=Bacillus solitudinis TaxID=2014074 RepID=UPI000C2494DE|nr:YlqD family protein [Bacillus solitudinis]